MGVGNNEIRHRQRWRGIEEGTVSHIRRGATGDKGIRSGIGAGTIATTQGDNVRMGSTVIVEVGSIVVGLLRDWAICILHQGARWPCGHRHGHGTGEGGEERRGEGRRGKSICTGRISSRLL